MEKGGCCGSKSPFNWVVWGLLAVVAVYAVMEHWSHLLGALPYLILLACPLMHLFMGHGHGSHDDHSQGSAEHKE